MSAPIPESVPVAVTAGDIRRIIRAELTPILERIEKRLAALESNNGDVSSTRATKTTTRER